MARPKGKGKYRFKWTEKRMAFVMAWKGDDADAAREAGYATPTKDCFRLMQFPEIAEAIRKQREKMLDKAADKKATKASKLDVIERALKLADMEPGKTNDNISGQVAALKLVAEMQGHIVRKTEDVTKQFEDKTEEEKEFFAVNGYFPPKNPNTIN
jgi:phage terminase small subunit